MDLLPREIALFHVKHRAERLFMCRSPVGTMSPPNAILCIHAAHTPGVGGQVGPEQEEATAVPLWTPESGIGSVLTSSNSCAAILFSRCCAEVADNRCNPAGVWRTTAYDGAEGLRSKNFQMLVTRSEDVDAALWQRPMCYVLGQQGRRRATSLARSV